MYSSSLSRSFACSRILGLRGRGKRERGLSCFVTNLRIGFSSTVVCVCAWGQYEAKSSSFNYYKGFFLSLGAIE